MLVTRFATATSSRPSALRSVVTTADGPRAAPTLNVEATPSGRSTFAAPLCPPLPPQPARDAQTAHVATRWIGFMSGLRARAGATTENRTAVPCRAPIRCRELSRGPGVPCGLPGPPSASKAVPLHALSRKTVRRAPSAADLLPVPAAARGPDPVGAVRHRAARAARREPRRRAARDGATRAAGAPCCRASRTTVACCARRTAPSPRRSAKSVGSRRPPSGSSTTSSSSTSSCARSATTCRSASIASCPRWPTALSPATRGCTASRGPSSRTPTAASIPTPCAVSCRRTSGCSRSRSASSGPSRSRCAWSWSRTCAAWRTRSCAGARRARRPTRSPTSSSA